MKIGLTAEVKWEVRALFKHVNLTGTGAGDGVLRGELNGHTLFLCLSGMEPSVAKARVSKFLDDYSPDVMISCGLAGALRSHLNVGDVIVQSPHPELVAIAEDALKSANVAYHVGPLVTVPKPVLSPVDRRELAARTDAIAADMESQIIAEFCRSRNIPCLALKGISDEIDDDLTPILGGFEVVHIPRIALRVLTHPGTWGLAARLARSSHRSATHLGRGVYEVISRIPESLDIDWNADELEVAVRPQTPHVGADFSQAT